MRPSQAVAQHGPGSIVDLPQLSVIMAGIDYWYPGDLDRVHEPRLERFLGVDSMFGAPRSAPGVRGGLPSFVFPESLVCPHARCRKLAHHRNFRRKGKDDSLHFVCTNSAVHSKFPTAFPARFLVACPRGHIDDFPWKEWVHSGESPCNGELTLTDTGRSGGAQDIVVSCRGCGKKRSMAGAFRAGAHSRCTGRQPWLGLGVRADGCSERPRTLLRGASNSYFSVVASALSIPPWSDPIHQDLVPFAQVIRQATSLEQFQAGVAGGFYNLGGLLNRYSVREIWDAFHNEPTAEDLKSLEWEAFTNPERPVPPGSEYEVSSREVPPTYAENISQVVAATRLREVRALRGFMRIDPIPDTGDSDDVAALGTRTAPLSRHDEPSWLPAVDLRGEGIFIRLDESRLRHWEHSPSVSSACKDVELSWNMWREERGLSKKEFPGMRYVVIHTLSHLLIRQLSFDSGYSSSSIRERLYVSDDPDSPMAGLLLYTATSDSDGSLGGLVDQAKPDRLSLLIGRALEDACVCAQDPLCGGSAAGGSDTLNGAACHACLLIAETSCEFANRLLDRGAIVGTIGGLGIEFFRV